MKGMFAHSGTEPITAEEEFDRYGPFTHAHVRQGVWRAPLSERPDVRWDRKSSGTRLNHRNNLPPTPGIPRCLFNCPISMDGAAYHKIHLREGRRTRRSAGQEYSGCTCERTRRALLGRCSHHIE